MENRITKAIGGPKKSLFQLFTGLNERTTGQSVQEMARVRDVCYFFLRSCQLIAHAVHRVHVNNMKLMLNPSSVAL